MGDLGWMGLTFFANDSESIVINIFLSFLSKLLFYRLFSTNLH